MGLERLWSIRDRTPLIVHGFITLATDRRALRLIVWSFIVFHGSLGVLETYGFAKGVSVKIPGNVAARAFQPCAA
jgi:hypothetical protein